jgi:hypothetical protein
MIVGLSNSYSVVWDTKAASAAVTGKDNPRKHTIDKKKLSNRRVCVFLKFLMRVILLM